MVTKYFLNLKTIKCSCNAGAGATCPNLELQPKLGDWSIGASTPINPKKVVKPKVISCPSTGNLSKLNSSNALGFEFKIQGRLHLFDVSNQWLYEGITPIQLAKKTNEKCEFSPAADATGGELNCSLSVHYDVNTVPNIIALTQQFIAKVVQLVVEFLRGLFSALVIYGQSLPIALTISVEELLSRFSRSEMNRSRLDQSGDRSDSLEDSSENDSDDDPEPPSEPPADSQ